MAGSLETIQSYRISLFQVIHEIIFHGNGGYDYNTVYNMPIWLRKFTFKTLKDWYNQKAESSSKSKSRNTIDIANPDKSKIPNSPVRNPPTYVTKASRK